MNAKGHEWRFSAIMAGLWPKASEVIRFLLLLALAGAATGCANVKPWQRGTLADVTMRPDRDPIGVAMGEHVLFSREAASGGRGVGGGGCGCN
jgi:hypothetical protein